MKNDQLLHNFYSGVCFRIDIKMKINFVLRCLFSSKLREVEIFMLPFSI